MQQSDNIQLFMVEFPDYTLHNMTLSFSKDHGEQRL